MKINREYGCGMRVFLLSVLFMAPCLPVLASEDGERFREIYVQEWDFRLKEFPLFASSVGVHDYDGQLGHVSEQVQARRNVFWKKIRVELDGISCERLDRGECINYRIFVKQMENYLAAYEIRSYLIPFNSDWGFYLEWARAAARYRFHQRAGLPQLPGSLASIAAGDG